MLIKICGITTLEDAAAAVGGGASAIGFNFWAGSPRFISPARARVISDSLPADVLRVGVFVNEEPSTIERVMTEAAVQVAQLHGSEPPSSIPSGVRAWKAFRVTAQWTAQRLPEYRVDAFLLDGPSPGNGVSFDWDRVRDIPYNIVLAGGLDASNVASAVRQVRPWGVDVCSRIERAPGIKDHNKMKEFLEAALQTRI